MEDKKLPKYMTLEQFQQGMRNWSHDTLARRVKHDAFPAFKDGGQWCIDRDKAALWFEKRMPRKVS